MRTLTRIAFAALTLAPALVPQAHAGSVTSTPVLKVAPSAGLIKPVGPIDGLKPVGPVDGLKPVGPVDGLKPVRPVDGLRPAGLGRLGLRANGVEILQ